MQLTNQVYLPLFTVEIFVVIECPPPPVVGNATRIGSGSSYGSVVVFTCPRGYYMGHTSEATFSGSRVSTQTVHCQADTQWSNIPENCYRTSFFYIILTVLYFWYIPLFCVVVQCPAIPVWLGVVVNTTWSAYGAAVMYSCASGFVFADRTANRSAVCGDHGYWFPNIIECQGQ